MAKMKTVFSILAIFLSFYLYAGAFEVNNQSNDSRHSKLVVTPANLNFFTCTAQGRPAPAPAPQTLQIKGVPNPRVHDGDGVRSDSLEWTASPSEDWINIEPASGFTPNEAMVSVDPAGLAVGEYAGTIEFNTPGQKKPRIVQIKLRIQTASANGFTLNPDHIYFSGGEFSNITLIDTVHLGVVGSDQLDFTTSNSQSWLRVVPSQATAPITVLLLASTDSLPEGLYNDTVVFKSQVSTDNNGEDHCLLDEAITKLPVTLTLLKPIRFGLVVSPERLGFAAGFGGQNPRPQNLMVSSLGEGNIGWRARKTQSWLNLAPDSGTATPEPQPVQVSIDITGLNPGLYSDTVVFHMGTLPPELGNKLIPVFLQVFPPSELSDSVAIGDGVIDLTDPQVNRFSIPIYASNTQAVRAIALPLHFQDAQTTLDSVIFAGGRAEFADLKLFLKLSKPGDFLILLGFVLAPALPPGEGIVGQLYFTTTGVLPQFADTLIIDSTSVPNATGDPNMPPSLSVSYLVFSGGNPLILNPSFKKGAVILRNFQNPTSADDEDGRRPLRFGLNQNYPNPFNPQTAIAFSLPKSSEVKLEVFDLLGRLVVTLTEGQLPAGTHTLVWDGRDRSGRTVSSGVYLYRLQAGSFVETKKMLFLK